MKTARIEFDQKQAGVLYRTYREHRNAQTETDNAIERVYREIARGRKVIRAFESIRQAGLDEQGLPKLAIVRADAEWCYCDRFREDMRFSMDRWPPRHATKRTIHVPWPGLENSSRSAKARVPLIPVHHRPKANLTNYHILWEADWQGIPTDPMLLRRMGGDLWLVLAAWDLTPVERAVLEGL